LSPRSGAVSAKLLEDPAAPELRLGPNEEFAPAFLGYDNPDPIYPRELLTRNVGPHVVTVRVTFDQRGSVLSVTDSPVGSSTQSAYAAQFRAGGGTAHLPASGSFATVRTATGTAKPTTGSSRRRNGSRPSSISPSHSR
jgi:hypothetical protein